MNPEQSAQEGKTHMQQQQKYSTAPPRTESSQQNSTAPALTQSCNAQLNDACLAAQHKYNLCHVYNLKHAHPQDLFRQERMHCLVCAKGKSISLLRTLK